MAAHMQSQEGEADLALSFHHHTKMLLFALLQLDGVFDAIKLFLLRLNCDLVRRI